MMRLFKGFLMLVLCMGLMVSCFEGPPGPQGEPGPKGDPGETDLQVPEEATHYYGFLKSWGVEDGRVACSDPVLMGDGAFPGTAELEDLVDASDNPAPVGYPVTCGDVLFAKKSVDASMEQGIMDIAHTSDRPMLKTVANGLVFVKKQEGMMDDSDKPREVPSTETSRAKRVVTTEYVSSGNVYAELSTSGANEEWLDRRDLYRDCDNGTAPPDLMGTWRGIYTKVVETPHNAQTKKPDTADNTATETWKVCVNFDAHPGSVKCFVKTKVDGPNDNMDSMSEQVAFYTPDEEMMLTPTMPEAGEDKMLPALTNPVEAANLVMLKDFFGMGKSLEVSATGTAVDSISKLCYLFGEDGVKQES